MINLVNASAKFLRRNGSTILTWMGGLGVLGTVVVTTTATKEAVKRVKQAEEAKGEDLTKLEVIKVAAPVYIPVAATGAATIACIFGANRLNKRKQAALISGYALLNNSYNEYKKKVKELYGEDAHENVIAEVAKEQYEKVEETVEAEDKTQLFYDTFSMQYFESTMENVLRAEYNLNRDLIMHESAYLNDWYAHLGIEGIESGYEYGWTPWMNYDHYWQKWIDFTHTKTTLDDGLEVVIIDFFTEPRLGFVDY